MEAIYLEPLYGKTLAELQQICSEMGMPRFAAKQIAGWLYKRGAKSIDQMSDLSLKNRSLLAERYTVGLSAPEGEQTSSDGTKNICTAPAKGSLSSQRTFLMVSVLRSVYHRRRDVVWGVVFALREGWVYTTLYPLATYSIK